MSNLKIFTDVIEPEATNQIYTLIKQPAFENCKVRIMPDVHAGAGCVIGFTANLGDKVISNIVGVDIGCVDLETEYLTVNGWKRISEYNNEEIAVFNTHDKTTYFEKPINYIKTINDEFYHLKTKYGIDQMLSKEHKCLVERGSHNKPCSRGQLYTLLAEDIVNKHKKLKLGFRDNFICNIPNIKLNTKNSLNDSQIRVQIMVMADGHIQNNGMCICKFKKQRKINRCLQLLNEANISYEIKNRSEEGLFAVLFNPPTTIKRISYFWNCNIYQLKIICDEVMKWDGTIKDDVFTSTYKEDADFVQYAFAVNGYRTSISYDSRKNKESYRCIVSKSKPRVQLAGTPKSDISIVKSSDGYKYCFTTNTGFWIMRRNNCICVTGNCGMATFDLGKVDIDFQKLDDIIRRHIPNGRGVHEGRIVKFDKIQELYCYRELKDTKRLERSIGTLGGGNHFIEIDEDNEGNKYLVIHSGSRNLGKQVADYYQNLAIELMQGRDDLYVKQEKLIAEYKSTGRKSEIQAAIKELHRKFKPNKLGIPKELCYLEGEYRMKYLHDMKICQEYADINRWTMARLILDKYGLNSFGNFTTVHNYIDIDSNIVRKGAVSAKKGEMLLIPINMRDGSLICKGKGNDDWNQSAPHGAGRLMSRSKAKELLSVDEFKDTMSNVWTSTVNQSTLDEAPMAYKSIDDIVNNIGNTVEILKVIKPVYNFKASE